MRHASPIECAEVAQAETVAKFGPWSPNSIETMPLAMLEIIIGIMKGEMRPGPFVMRLRMLVLEGAQAADAAAEHDAKTLRILHGAVPSPASCIAFLEAAMANCVKRSHLRLSLVLLNHFSGSNPWISPANRQSNCSRVEQRDRDDAAAAMRDVIPERAESVSHRGLHTHSSDDDAAKLDH